MKTLSTFLMALGSLTMIAQSYQTIEAVEYDQANNRYLVSNVNSIIARQADGTLAYFGDGNKASYGMEIIGNTLFAIHSTQSSNTIYGYDLTTEEEVMELTIPGADFLNGMGSDGVSKLWVSDFGNYEILEIDVADLDNPSFTVVVGDTGSKPNGVVYDETEDRILFCSWGFNAPIKAINPDTYEVTTLVTTNLDYCDGIDNDSDNNFFVSSWQPTRITKFNSDFTTDEIVTAPGLENPADISYAQDVDTLAVANSGNETVSFIGFGTTGILDMSKDELKLDIYPNPVSQTSIISFYNPVNQRVRLIIVDGQGKIHSQLLDEDLSPGEHRVLLAGYTFAAGYYICEIQYEGSVLQFPFLVE